MSSPKGLATTIPRTMGQPITAIEKPSSVPGTVRFEINRNLTGMGHERYVAGTPVQGDRPPDRLARDLFARGGIDSVHIYNNVITIDLDEHRDAEGLKEIVEGLYIYYRPGVEVVIPEGAEA
jgi:hypothetical protein